VKVTIAFQCVQAPARAPRAWPKSSRVGSTLQSVTRLKHVWDDHPARRVTVLDDVPARRVAVFLDRDGTLNRAYDVDGVSVPPSRVAEVEILPGVGPGLARLKQAGFDLIVASNQPDVSRGTQSLENVEAINQVLAQQLPLDEIVCCYHDNADACGCRKPKAGMLVDTARRRGIDLARSYMVGDRWRDIEAGRRAGCTTVLLPATSPEPNTVRPDFEAANFEDAVQFILGCQKERDASDDPMPKGKGL
jgi:D-glycero-D-manno-heptose 1,7-bisphosphate phosphatase